MMSEITLIIILRILKNISYTDINYIKMVTFGEMCFRHAALRECDNDNDYVLYIILDTTKASALKYYLALIYTVKVFSNIHLIKCKILEYTLCKQ